jgi:hypothetical protein
MWPAVRLAANRKERVIGRTLILSVSIITKNGFNQSGAPPGRSPATNDDGACIAPEIIRESHRGRPRIKVIIRCLDILKV